MRDGENPSRLEAACCRVEVVKGALGFRFLVVSLTSLIVHLPPLASFSILVTSFLSRGSSLQVSVTSSLFLVLKSALRLQ